MTAVTRRKKITQILQQNSEPVSAATLAKECQVSRQIVVGDIALLRASGLDILATPSGYMIARSHSGLIRTLACHHDEADLKKELYAVVDNGGGVLDVIVEHPIYGQLTGQLNIFSRYDADQFISNVNSNKAPLLSQLTDGLHLHTVSCKDEQTYQRILTALEDAGLLLEKS